MLHCDFCGVLRQTDDIHPRVTDNPVQVYLICLYCLVVIQFVKDHS